VPSIQCIHSPTIYSSQALEYEWLKWVPAPAEEAPLALRWRTAPLLLLVPLCVRLIDIRTNLLASKPERLVSPAPLGRMKHWLTGFCWWLLLFLLLCALI
jgi:hypothetical protein